MNSLRSDVHLAADLRRKGVHQIVADERVVDRVAVVAAAEVRVAVVDLHVPDAQRHVLHHVVERPNVDRQLVDQQETVLDPGLVVVPRREIAGQLDADASCQLRVQVQIRGRVVEPETDVLQLVRVHAVDDDRDGGVLVVQPLHLRGKRRAEVDLEAGVLDPWRLRRFEHVDAPLIQRTEMLHGDGPAILWRLLFLRLGGRRRTRSGVARRRLRGNRRGIQQNCAHRGGDANCGFHDRFLRVEARRAQGNRRAAVDHRGFRPNSHAAADARRHGAGKIPHASQNSPSWRDAPPAQTRDLRANRR